MNRSQQLAAQLTDAWFPLRDHALQSKLWRTTARFPVVVAGRGSGKTMLMRRKLVRLLPVIRPWRNPIYLYCMPTYAQAERIGWEEIIPLIPPEWIETANSSKLRIKTVFGSTLYVVGMDKPQRIEGAQVDGVVYDESSDQKPTGYTKTILPMLSERNGWCARIGVPKRNGAGAIEFKAAYDAGCLPNDIGLESYTWSSNTVRSDEELRVLKEQMTDRDADEQFGGLWVDQEGQIYYAYNDTLNLSTDCLYNKDLAVGVASDFNVNPMAWVLFHYSDGVFRIFDEIWKKDTNTQATLDLLYNRYPIHRAGWQFFGDASSQNRHTSTTVTDYNQIKNDGRFQNKQVFYPAANPGILDRYASVNSIICNANQRRSLFIHPKCEKLRSDLVACTYKEGTREIDTTNKERGHITDALGYAIMWLRPLRTLILDKQQAHFSQQTSAPVQLV